MVRKITVAKELNAYTVIPLINSFNEFINKKQVVEAELDFTNTTFVSPSGLAPLLAYLRENKDTKHEVLLNSVNSPIHTYICRMGFYELLGLESDYKCNKYSSKGRFQEPYYFSKDTNPEEVTLKASNIIKTFSKNRNLQNYNEAIGWCVSEVIDNAQNHSESDVNVAMAQKYPYVNITEFCVADRGIGIKNSMDEKDAKIALEKCITKAKGKRSEGCGNGLFYTSELIKRDTSGKSSMTIWSENYMLILHSNSEPVIKKTEAFWQGVNISISMYNGISENLTELMKNIDNYDYSFSYKNMPDYYESMFEN